MLEVSCIPLLLLCIIALEDVTLAHGRNLKFALSERIKVVLHLEIAVQNFLRWEKAISGIDVDAVRDHIRIVGAGDEMMVINFVWCHRKLVCLMPVLGLRHRILMK